MKNVYVTSTACIHRNVTFPLAKLLGVFIVAALPDSLSGQATSPPPRPAAATDEDVVEMEEFVVEGALLGKARALDIQKQATNIVNVVSSDSMGTFPDINAAEALARLPGINIVRSDGEGRFVTIRGAKPNFNGVLMNGFTSPSGDRDERRVDLQTVPNALIERIEVTKAATPDLSSEGIGGVTNIMFRNPADIKESEGTLSVDYGIQEYDGNDKNAAFFYADHIGRNENFAFVVSAAVRSAPRATYSITSTGWGQTPEGVWRPASYGLAWDDLERQRRGYDLAVGYKLSEKTKLEARAFYSRFGEPEFQHRLSFGSINPLRDTSGAPVEFNASGGLVTASVNRNHYYQYWNQSITGFTFKGNHDFSDTLKLDVGLARQTNKEYYPFDRGYLAANTAVTGGVFRLSVLDKYSVLAPTNAAAEAAYDGSFHRINQFDNATDRLDREIEDVFFANLKKQFELSGESSLELKAGFYGRFRDKDIDRERSILSQVASSNFTFADVLIGGTETDYAGKGILFGDYSDTDHFYDVLNRNPASFTVTSQTEHLGFGVGDYLASEDVYAFYLQGTYQVGKFTAVTGVRHESTEVTLDRLNNLNQPVRFDPSYDHLMPSIHLRYDVTPEVVVRASWSNTVGRHDYGDRIFGPVTVNRTAQTITIPNVGLKPLESENIDVSVDWYSGPLGLFSVGYFTKDIENFPLATSRSITYEGLPYTENTVQAGVTGEIRGWEVAFNRRFEFLPAPFNGLGVDINFAKIDSEIGLPTRPDNPRMDQQPDWVLNASLYYAHDKFYVRLAQSGRSELVNRNGLHGTNPALDVYQGEYLQYDLTFSYDFSRQIQLYGEWRNITSENEEYYQGDPSRPTESKFNGYTYGAGVRWRF